MTSVAGSARSDRITGIVLLVLGLAAGAEATTFEVAFLTDPVGPKALPLLVALILIFGGAYAALRPSVVVDWPARGVLLRMTGAAAAFLGYSLALPFLGFWLSTTLVVAALSHLYGAPPKRGVAAAAALAGALWLIFVVALDLPLPIGDLWML